jgi:hypothetical protein
MRMKVLVPVVVVLAGLGVFAIVRDTGKGNGNSSGALTASEHKYCTLVKQFRAPTFPKDPAHEQFTAIMSDYVTKNAKYFEELLKVTPAEIKPDVDKAITTLRRVATGDISAYDGLDLTRADQWEGDHCNR